MTVARTTSSPETTEIGPQPGPQELFLSLSPEVQIAIYGGAAGGGKRLSLQTPIATPSGWTTMGELRAGDVVFSDLGLPTRVLIAHRISIEAESYRLLFDDGSTIEAGADHLWLTYTLAERGQLLRRTETWRARHRSQRPSHVNGRKSAAFTAMITARNRLRRGTGLSIPTGLVRTTREIAASVRVGGRVNHAIPVVRGPLELAEASLPLDPYLLGCWLGDGTTREGSMTTADPEIVAAFAASFQLSQPRKQQPGSPCVQFWVRGLTAQLRQLGVLGNKHVPPIYLRASVKQRLALLQGLMDTDGGTGQSGGVEFSSTTRGLVDAVAELACSLGHKVTVRARPHHPVLNGVPCKPSYSMKWTAPDIVFRLERKASRQRLASRQTTRFRYIVACRRIAPRPMRCITVDSPSRLYLAGRSLIPTHNTWALLMEPLYHLRSVRGFGAVIFRRDRPQITNEGGLWDSSYEVYPQLGAIANQTALSWAFPPYGNAVTFAHMQYEQDRFSWDGSQIPLIGFDELTSFTAKQFFFMLSRNRSTFPGVHPYMRATCNPDADSWVADFIAWWIDQDGFAIEERSGKVQYFVRADNDQLVWSYQVGGLEALKARFPDHAPLSVTFVPAKLDDNQILVKRDPGYRGRLQNLDSVVERERRLRGNWRIKPSAGTYFDRNWFGLLDVAPTNVMFRIRYWDKAGSTSKGSSYTVGVRMAVTEDGQYLVEHVVRGQWLASDRNEVILQTAELDGVKTQIWTEQEPGSGGKESAEATKRDLERLGYSVEIDRVTGDKESRAIPMAGASRGRRVKLLRANWNETYLDELYSFPDGRAKDQVDASSGAFNQLKVIYDEVLRLTGGEADDSVLRSDYDGIPPGEHGGNFLDQM